MTVPEDKAHVTEFTLTVQPQGHGRVEWCGATQQATASLKCFFIKMFINSQCLVGVLYVAQNVTRQPYLQHHISH